jgi:hypothetical protein
MISSASQPSARIRRRWLLLVLVILGAAAYPYVKKSGPIQLMRGILTSEAGARVIANDLADDVRHKWRLRALQRWSTHVLARYRTGNLATNGHAAYWSLGNVQLAPQEVPFWLKHGWLGESPEFSVRVTEFGNPECVTVGWYLSGLIVGPTNYVTSLTPWYIVQAKPGIYAYHGYK